MKVRHLHLQQDLEAVVNEKEVYDFKWILHLYLGRRSIFKVSSVAIYLASFEK